jgi:citrate lyase subunit beta/citryl-CoA lyase
VTEALTVLDPDRVIVRLNPLGTEHGRLDVEAMRTTRCRTVMVPKAEDAAALDELHPWEVIALVETAVGFRKLDEIANSRPTAALMWGGEDLTADLGGRRSRDTDGTYLPHVEYARMQTLFAASAAGRAAIDGVWLAITDLNGLAAESRKACLMGFRYKAAIHPTHAAVIRSAFMPEPEEVTKAQEIIDAATAAEGGAYQFEGRMIDEPLLRQARRILEAAEGSVTS